MGKDNIVPGHKPTIFDDNLKKKEDEGGERIRGSVMFKRTAGFAVMAKSTCAVVSIPKFVEADTGILPLPTKTTVGEAKAKIATLGELSLGIVPFKTGYVIRYLRSQEKEVNTLIDTKHTALCGIDLMLADKKDGKAYIVRNECSSYNAAAFVNKMKEK